MPPFNRSQCQQSLPKWTAKQVFDCIVASNVEESVFISGFQTQEILTPIGLYEIYNSCAKYDSHSDDKIMIFARNCHKLIFNFNLENGSKHYLRSRITKAENSSSNESRDEFNPYISNTDSNSEVPSVNKIKTVTSVNRILPLFQNSIFADADKRLNFAIKRSLSQRIDVALKNLESENESGNVDLLKDISIAYIWQMLHISTALFEISKEYNEAKSALASNMASSRVYPKLNESKITSLYLDINKVVVKILKTFVYEGNENLDIQVDKFANLFQPSFVDLLFPTNSDTDISIFVEDLQSGQEEISVNIEVKKYIKGFQSSTNMAVSGIEIEEMKDISNLIFPGAVHFEYPKLNTGIMRPDYQLPLQLQLQNIRKVGDLFQQIVTYMIKHRNVYSVITDLFSTNILLKFEVNLFEQMYSEEEEWLWYSTDDLPVEYRIDIEKNTETGNLTGLQYEIFTKLLNHRDFKELVDYNKRNEDNKDAEDIERMMERLQENFLSIKISEKETRLVVEHLTLGVLKKNIIFYLAKILRNIYGLFENLKISEFCKIISKDHFIKKWSQEISEFRPLPFSIKHLPFNNDHDQISNQHSKFDNIQFFQSLIIAEVYGLDRDIKKDGLQFTELVSNKLKRFVIKDISMSRVDRAESSAGSSTDQDERHVSKDSSSTKFSSTLEPIEEDSSSSYLESARMSDIQENHMLKDEFKELSLSGNTLTSNVVPKFELTLFTKDSAFNFQGKIKFLDFLASSNQVEVIKDNVLSPICSFIINRAGEFLPKLFPGMYKDQEKINLIPQKVVIKVYIKSHMVKHLKANYQFEEVFNHYSYSPEYNTEFEGGTFDYGIKYDIEDVLDYNFSSDSDSELSSDSEDDKWRPSSDEVEKYCEDMFKSARREGLCYEKINDYNQNVLENTDSDNQYLRSFKILDKSKFYDGNDEGYFILTEYIEPDQQDLAYYAKMFTRGNKEEREKVRQSYKILMKDMEEQFEILSLLHIQHDDIKSHNLLMKHGKLYIHDFSEARIKAHPSHDPGDINSAISCGMMY